MKIKQYGTCQVGPYKGYYGRAEFDPVAGIFHGEVLGTRDVITFETPKWEEVLKVFVESVDDYLEFCASRNEAPDKPFSGQFVTRLTPKLHRDVSLLAHLSGKSLNTFVADRLKEVIEEASPEAVTELGFEGVKSGKVIAKTGVTYRSKAGIGKARSGATSRAGIKMRKPVRGKK